MCNSTCIIDFDHHTTSYVETAILKCYSFLTDREYTQALIRLTRMVRGIGDPLVACYARAYLCRVGISVAPDTKNHLMPNFTDYLKTVDQVGVWDVEEYVDVNSACLSCQSCLSARSLSSVCLSVLCLLYLCPLSVYLPRLTVCLYPAPSALSVCLSYPIQFFCLSVYH